MYIKSAGNTARTSLIPTTKAEQNQVSTTTRVACQAFRLWRLVVSKTGGRGRGRGRGGGRGRGRGRGRGLGQDLSFC